MDAARRGRAGPVNGVTAARSRPSRRSAYPWAKALASGRADRRAYATSGYAADPRFRPRGDRMGVEAEGWSRFPACRCGPGRGNRVFLGCSRRNRTHAVRGGEVSCSVRWQERRGQLDRAAARGTRGASTRLSAANTVIRPTAGTRRKGRRRPQRSDERRRARWRRGRGGRRRGGRGARLAPCWLDSEGADWPR